MARKEKVPKKKDFEPFQEEAAGSAPPGNPAEKVNIPPELDPIGRKWYVMTDFESPGFVYFFPDGSQWTIPKEELSYMLITAKGEHYHISPGGDMRCVSGFIRYEFRSTRGYIFESTHIG